MLASGTAIVGGVNPRKAGQVVDFHGGEQVPVFGSVGDAMAETGANVTVVFVPAAFTKSAVVEAIDAGIPLCVVITEGVAGQGHRGVLQLQRRHRYPDHRPELPRPDQPRPGQRRHHPGGHLRPRPDRPGVASRAR